MAINGHHDLADVLDLSLYNCGALHTTSKPAHESRNTGINGSIFFTFGIAMYNDAELNSRPDARAELLSAVLQPAACPLHAHCHVHKCSDPIDLNKVERMLRTLAVLVQFARPPSRLHTQGSDCHMAKQTSLCCQEASSVMAPQWNGPRSSEAMRDWAPFGAHNISSGHLNTVRTNNRMTSLPSLKHIPLKDHRHLPKKISSESTGRNVNVCFAALSQGRIRGKVAMYRQPPRSHNTFKTGANASVEKILWLLSNNREDLITCAQTVCTAHDPMRMAAQCSTVDV